MFVFIVNIREKENLFVLLNKKAFKNSTKEHFAPELNVSHTLLVTKNSQNKY